MSVPFRVLAATAVTVFGVVAGFIGHTLDQHPRVQAAITKAALEADEEGARYLSRFGFSCGVQSWSVKTMADTDASSVNLSAHVTTIASLVAPAGVPGQRVSPPAAVTLAGTVLTAYKTEPDSDIHLVLRSPRTGQTMIAEIPNPTCSGSSRVLAQITQARADFVREVGAPQTYFTYVQDVIKVTGVGFYDFLHGQNGVAPNGVELHPVVAFTRWS